MSHARYEIVENESGRPLVIRDVGPWDLHSTVTHDVAFVVRELFEKGLLRPPERKLLYLDSQGDLDEIVHDQRGGYVRFTYWRSCIDCGGKLEAGEIRCTDCLPEKRK